MNHTTAGAAHNRPVERAEDTWGGAAEAYLKSSVHGDEAALSRIVDLLKPSGGAYLDVAAGAGHCSYAIAPFVDVVVACDSSPGMLRLVHREASNLGLHNLITTRGTADRIPFRSGAFDGVVCRTAAHHFTDVQRFLAEAFRVLKAGQKALVIDNVGNEDPDTDRRVHELETLRDPTHVRCHTAKEWKRLARRVGFWIDFEDVVSKPINAVEWLNRLNVEEPRRSEALFMIEDASGWFREHLRPHGSGDLLTFHLNELTLLLSKP